MPEASMLPQGLWLPMIFSSLDTSAKTDLKATENQVGCHTQDCSPRRHKRYLFTPCINCFEGSMQNTAIFNIEGFLNKALKNVTESYFYFSEAKMTSGNLPLEKTLKNIRIISYVSHRDSSLRKTIIKQLSKKVLLNKSQNNMLLTEIKQRQHHQQKII